MRIVTSLIQPLLFLFVLGSGPADRDASERGRRRPDDVHLPRRALHLGDVHRDLQRGLDRLGPRVRLPARDDGRAGAPQLDRDRQVPRRRDRREPAGRGPDRARRRWSTCRTAWSLILGIFGMMLLLAFAMTAFGVMIAVRIKQMQSFMGVTQMVVMPMFFISGALFPVDRAARLAGVPEPARPDHLRGRPDAQARASATSTVDGVPGRDAGSAGTCPSAARGGVVLALGLADAGASRSGSSQRRGGDRGR